jgi:uncharacterized membrane protein YoaK (UPF0700 family)
VAVFPGVILPHLLSLTAGFVDAAGFLVLQGLFIAHATGNFVTLGASLVLGTSGAIAKLLALPVFCIFIVATRFLSGWLSQHQKPPLPVLLALKFALLVLGRTLAIHFGPFGNRDEWDSIVTGMVLVAAMAVQNAARRIHLASDPPSTLMTGTTTQVMIDLADMLQWLGEGRNGVCDKCRQICLSLQSAARPRGRGPALYPVRGVAFRCSANHLGHHRLRPDAREVPDVDGFVGPLYCVQFGQAVRCGNSALLFLFDRWRRPPILVKA